MQSLSAEQRAELSALMNTALEDMDLAREMQQLGDALRSRRPDLDWRGRERMRGDEPLGVGDATSALQDLADLDELESALRQDYPGAALDDIDEEAVQRALGRRPSTTCTSCAGSSASWRTRATSPGRATGWTSPPRPSAGWARPRCDGSSPTCGRRAAARHDVHDAGRRASSPAPAGRGSSATSSRWTSYAP